MKKNLIIIMIAALVVSSCGTYTGAGAYAGASLGGHIGSVLGCITGGHRGSDLGALVGMAGGAAVGAMIGAAADQKVDNERAAYAQGRADERRSQRRTWRSGSRRSNSSYIQRNSQYLKDRRGDDVYYNGGNNGASYTRVNPVQPQNNSDYNNDGGYDETNSGDDRIEMK